MGAILLTAFLFILVVVVFVVFIMGLCFLSVTVGNKTGKPHLSLIILFGPLILLLFVVVSFTLLDEKRTDCENESESDCKCEYVDYECVCTSQEIVKPTSPCDKE